MENNAVEPKVKTKNPNKNKRISIGVLVIGLIVLVVGVVFLVINLVKMNQAADGEYLVAQDNWVLESDARVIWDFTEIGKGTLTTNDHINDYNFIWALEDGKIKIETDWLYDLENEYSYKLDQGAGVLTLETNDGATYKFTARR